jgi:hypothetical protein
MDLKTELALERSIKHWELITFDPGNFIDIGPNTCALCHVFNTRAFPELRNNRDSFMTCVGCPVYEKTGRVFCAGSPYEDYAEEFDDETTSDSTLKYYARAEVEFLKSLRVTR